MGWRFRFDHEAGVLRLTPRTITLSRMAREPRVGWASESDRGLGWSARERPIQRTPWRRWGSLRVRAAVAKLERFLDSADDWYRGSVRAV